MEVIDLSLLNYVAYFHFHFHVLSNFDDVKVTDGQRGVARLDDCLDREGLHLQRHFVGGNPFCC